MNWKPLVRLSVILLLFSLAAGCSGPRVKVAMSATANLNLNEFDEPLPVVIRFYQLSDNKAFEKAAFEELWKKDLVTLGDALLTKEEVVINPGTQERLIYPRHDQAKYVGVMAIFRRPGGEGWRSVKTVASGFISRQFSNSVTVSLKGNSVEIVD
ncbi:type VI secretion system outer membrane lipoprotein TssJ [Desulfuromonas soudanensis]|uniref:Type VI secretion system outer membrane lipoprotein TssJ n=1 Tax=Desulfuromonas soudanensis TaxID=1603606 RepID=A0A0M4DKW5_9BACT|nr:type VI secretion system lipoprotein TssJ [Desulfuromonas soudanensis]ALC17982.1 type VI secretion system outer membrane lipoprotein TssJ [Desulfuromonas soudanensis]